MSKSEQTSVAAAGQSAGTVRPESATASGSARPVADNQKLFDVALLGSGLAGSALAAILARHGLDVVLIDAGVHPRFAIGESTIPYTSMLMQVVSARYDVPEIKQLASFSKVQKHVSTPCGVKRTSVGSVRCVTLSKREPNRRE